MANPNTRSSFTKLFTFTDLSSIPGPRGLDYLSKYRLLFRDNFLNAFLKMNEEYGEIVSLPWPINSVIIYSPEYVKKVLIEDGKKYDKGEQTEEFRALVGEGLLTTNHYKSWLKSRAIISKVFGPKSVVEFSKTFDELTMEHIKNWKDESIDFNEDMRVLTFKIICKTLLKSDLGAKEAKVINEAVNYTSKIIYERVFQLFPIPYSIPLKKHRIFRRHYLAINNIIMSIIQQEKLQKNLIEKDCILAKLVHAVDEETGIGFTDEELRDEILTMVLGGFETTAHALTSVLSLLAHHQEIQNRLFLEIDQFKMGPEKYISEITFLKHVIHESMRLYPPTPVITRKANEDLTLGLYKIPKHTNVVIPMYIMQRSEKNFKNADQFNPDRGNDVDFEKSFAHLPFSKGTRRCVAEGFAMTEISIIVFNILKTFKLELVNHELSKEHPVVSTKPNDKLLIKVKSRKFT